MSNEQKAMTYGEAVSEIAKLVKDLPQLVLSASDDYGVSNTLLSLTIGSIQKRLDALKPLTQKSVLFDGRRVRIGDKVWAFHKGSRLEGKISKVGDGGFRPADAPIGIEIETILNGEGLKFSIVTFTEAGYGNLWGFIEDPIPTKEKKAPKTLADAKEGDSAWAMVGQRMEIGVLKVFTPSMSPANAQYSVDYGYGVVIARASEFGIRWGFTAEEVTKP